MSLKAGDIITFVRTFTARETAIIASFTCKNQNEKEVLKGDFSGVIL